MPDAALLSTRCGTPTSVSRAQPALASDLDDVAPVSGGVGEPELVAVSQEGEDHFAPVIGDAEAHFAGRFSTPVQKRSRKSQGATIRDVVPELCTFRRSGL